MTSKSINCEMNDIKLIKKKRDEIKRQKEEKKNWRWIMKCQHPWRQLNDWKWGGGELLGINCFGIISIVIYQCLIASSDSIDRQKNLIFYSNELMNRKKFISIFIRKSMNV